MIEIFEEINVFLVDRLNVVRWCSSPQNEPSLSEIILKCPRSEASSINIKSFLQAFHSVNCITEQYVFKTTLTFPSCSLCMEIL